MSRWLLLAFAVSGCSYPEFAFAGDGAPSSETAPPGDASSQPDSSAIDSAAPDTFVADTPSGEVSPDAPKPTGCAAVTAKHCFDWESATRPEDGWSSFAVGAPGTISLEATGGISGSKGFLATTSPGSGDVVVANLIKTITTSASDTVVKVDVWLMLETDKFPGTDGAFIFKVQRNGGSGDGVTFSLGTGGFYVDCIAMPYRYFPLSYAPKIGTWMHVRMHAKLLATDGSVTVWIDDMVSPVLSESGIATAAEESTERSVALGLYSQKATGTLRARYDDVVIDY